jgi:hypothetical protein
MNAKPGGDAGLFACERKRRSCEIPGLLRPVLGESSGVAPLSFEPSSGLFQLERLKSA